MVCRVSRTKRVKKAVVAEPHRDPRLVALAERAEKAGWQAEWCETLGHETWLRLYAMPALASTSTPSVAVFAGAAELYVLADSGNGGGETVLAAMRSAYAQLGVALDQAEDIFADETGEMA